MDENLFIMDEYKIKWMHEKPCHNQFVIVFNPLYYIVISVYHFIVKVIFDEDEGKQQTRFQLFLVSYFPM